MGKNMIKPVRIQLSRKKGFNLQEVSKSINGLEAKKVARRSKYGNQFKVGEFCNNFFTGFTNKLIENNQMAVDYFEKDTLMSPVFTQCIKRDLKGFNLACFFKLSEVCHVDILLKIANEV